TGELPAATFVDLAEPLGNTIGGMLLDAIKLDVDTDDDGEFDAAAFRLESTASEIELASWQ
ncbi:MAG: hypothetical protein QGG40_22410, partial [Myxococcota bacterium]|nr:hypothetical protein [Myxococcota bacterium]